MRKVKHWLHILLSVLTSGLWLPIYLILLGTTEMYNRGYREGKAAGRVARQNEIDEERAKPKFEWKGRMDPRTSPNCRCVVTPLNEEAVTAVQNYTTYGVNQERRAMAGLSEPVECYERTKIERVQRLNELRDRVRTVGLDQYERAEFAQLTQEFGR